MAKKIVILWKKSGVNQACTLNHAYLSAIQVESPYYSDKTSSQDTFSVYWNNIVDKKSRHWMSLGTLCLPKEEGGVGSKSLFDVSNA